MLLQGAEEVGLDAWRDELLQFGGDAALVRRRHQSCDSGADLMIPRKGAPQLPADQHTVVWRSKRRGNHANRFHSDPDCEMRRGKLLKSKLGAALAAKRLPCRCCWANPQKPQTLSIDGGTRNAI